MNLLKGFGKDYFSFSALTMYSTAKKISDISIISKIVSFNNSSLSQDNEDAPTEEGLLLELSTQLNKVRPCHCDCVFRLKTKLATHIFKYIPRCPFYTTYFAFRRTGVHPPLLSL